MLTGKNVGTLQGLWKEAKDVVDHKDAGCCIIWTCYVGLQVVDLCPFAFLLLNIALGPVMTR